MIEALTKPIRMTQRNCGPAQRRTCRPFGGQLLASFLGLIAGGPAAFAVGGTATPPAPGLGAPSYLATPAPFVPQPIFSVPQNEIKGFTLVGFLQNATVSGSECAPDTPPVQFGGTAVINDTLITIPCNTTLQMPAATFKWAELFDPTKFTSASPAPASLTLDGTPPTSAPTFAFASIEVTVVGNIVGGRYIAGLLYLSQHSLNTSDGYITGFDYPNGVIYVAKTKAGASQTRLQLNDVNGRFSKGQSPDSRFNVDDANPTIHAITGYPMCVPRTNPTTKDDPLCPQRNRPLAASGCRNFAAAGITLPTAREMAPPAKGQVYCSNFVMPDPATAGPKAPISKQQAPLEVGDYITYAGTLLVGDGKGPNGSDTISVHTINANLGIYTQPGTMPVYLVMGEFSISANSPLTFNGVPQEAPDRLVLEAFVTDVTSIVDAYLVDIDPVSGQETQRWVTSQDMTGEFGAFGTNDLFIDGGITTQFTGPVPGRVRMRAGKATPGVLNSPTRYLRVVARSLCDPININYTAPLLESVPPKDVACLQRAPAANGLFTGQYLAPVFEFLFPENVVPGDATVPNNFWAMNFLVTGEGPGTGPLAPTPW